MKVRLHRFSGRKIVILLSAARVGGSIGADIAATATAGKDGPSS